MNQEGIRVRSSHIAGTKNTRADYLSRQLHQMEEDEKDLRKEITREGLSNQLLSQLINIYQQKLSVLEKLQKEINKTNTCYKQNKQPNAVQQNYFLHL